MFPRDSHCFLIAWGKGAECVLHAVAELPEHLLRDIEGILSHEVNAHAFRADEPHDLLDLLRERAGDIGEEQVRLIKKEDELWLIEITDFRELLEKLAEQPEQQGRINARVFHELLRGEQIDHPAAGLVRLQEIFEVQRGLAEEPVAPCCSSARSWRWIAADTCAGDIAVLQLSARARSHRCAEALRVGLSGRAGAGPRHPRL
jgi:hypothetical protein